MKKENKGVLRALAMVSQVGITMITPVFLAGAIGLALDRWLSTGIFFIAFLVIGVLASFRSLFVLMRQFYAKDLEREKREQAYLDGMKKEREERQREEKGEGGKPRP